MFDKDKDNRLNMKDLVSLMIYLGQNLNPVQHARFFIEGTVGIEGNNPAVGESTNGLGLGIGMSATTAMAGPPRSVARACTPSATMSTAMTLAPSAASRRAVARPTPEPAPVTIAVLPSNRMSTMDPPGRRKRGEA